MLAKAKVLTYVLSATALLALSLGGALLYERAVLEKSVKQYVSIWEEDIVQTLILKKDKQLLEKIIPQLQLISPNITHSSVSLLSDQFKISDQRRLDSFQIPLALNYMTIGLVQVEVSKNLLLISALLSPLFLVSLSLIVGFLLVLISKEQKSFYEKTALQEKLNFQSQVSQMARRVAHDIRSPVGALRAIASKPGAIGEEYIPFFNQISERVLGIAEELLSYSRNPDLFLSKPADVANSDESGHPVSLTEIEETLSSEFKAKYPNINWKFDVKVKSEEEFLSLDISRRALEAVLANVIQNSCEASASNIHIQLHERKSDVALCIKDNGKGIPEEIKAQLFQKEISFGKSNGNGIGLQSAKNKIEAAGGKIALMSNLDQGTLVQIQIPIQR